MSSSSRHRTTESSKIVWPTFEGTPSPAVASRKFILNAVYARNPPGSSLILYHPRLPLVSCYISCGFVPLWVIRSDFVLSEKDLTLNNLNPY